MDEKEPEVEKRQQAVDKVHKTLREIIDQGKYQGQFLHTISRKKLFKATRALLMYIRMQEHLALAKKKTE